MTIGIEVKYLSGLSSDDDIGISDEATEQIVKEEAQKVVINLQENLELYPKKAQAKQKYYFLSLVVIHVEKFMMM